MTANNDDLAIAGDTLPIERMLKWFAFSHLPEHLQIVFGNEKGGE